MRRLAVLVLLVLLASAASVRADDRAGDRALRAVLARGRAAEAGAPHAFVKVRGQVTVRPGGVALAELGGLAPDEVTVIGHGDHARQIAFHLGGALIVAWVADDQLAPLVPAERGVAMIEDGAPPPAGGYGWFVERGQPVDGEPKDGRVHVTVNSEVGWIKGWIDATGLVLEAAPDAVGGAGWKRAPEGSQLTVGDEVLATVDNDDVWMRRLPHGKGELGGVGWRARGTLDAPKPKPTPLAAPAAVAVATLGVRPEAEAPPGACLYAPTGELMGAVDDAPMDARPDGDHLAVDVNGGLGTPTIAAQTHGLGAQVERCRRGRAR